MAKLSRSDTDRVDYHHRNMAALTHWLNSTDDLGPDAVALLLIMIGAARTDDASITFLETELNRLMGISDEALLLTLNELHGHGYITDYEVTPWIWTIELCTDAAYDEEDDE